MRIHEINAGTLTPENALRDWGAPHYVCRCLLIEFDEGLVAVDTGIGLRDIAEPAARLGEDWVGLACPSLDPQEALVTRVEALGHDPERVTDIILTHQHRDHVGGLADLPRARVHALPAMRAAVETPASDRDGDRGRPVQWEHGVLWAPDPTPSAQWHGLGTFTMDGLDDRVRLVDLPGHSVGHAGVLIRAEDAWVFHVGDAAFHPSQYLGGKVPPGVAAFTRATEHDPTARVATERALSRIARLPGVRILTAHGPVA